MPYATKAKVIQNGLGAKVDFHSVSDAGQYSFLTPCGLLKLTPIWADPTQLAHAGFYQTMNQRVTAYFAENLE